jgi:lipoate-protein ligase A
MSQLSSSQVDYNLPDIQVMNSRLDFAFQTWQPDAVYIVLGRSNSAEKAVYTDLAEKDGVKIIKRPSGGESVVLSPSMMVFSSKFLLKKDSSPATLFKMVNKSLIDSLSGAGIKNLSSKGISDLTINDKKILGSSMYLKNNYLFYHAVLNISEDVSLISKYLKHPSKEPDYRQGRVHKEFITSLQNEGYNIEYHMIELYIERAFKNLYSLISANIN